MASQESSPQPDNPTPAEKKQETAEAAAAKKTTNKSSKPRKPKGKTSSGKEDKTKAKPKDNTTKKELNEKTQKKHEKLVKKGKRLTGDEVTALGSKSKDKQEISKIKTKSKKISIKSITTKHDKESSIKALAKTSITDKEKPLNKPPSEDKPETAVDRGAKGQENKASTSKSRNLRLSLKPNRKRRPKDEADRKDRREETIKEKGHNKDLLDSVYHKMEIEVDALEHTVKKEPEPVTEIKYSSYDDVSQRVVGQVNKLIDSFHQIFQLYKPNEVLLSFNGGKDCTVVLHLLHKFYQMNTCLKHIKLPTLYITDPDVFEEVDEFVEDCEKLFNIELIRKPGPIKKALEEICKEKPYIKAVFMGCRRTDPYCQDLKPMQPTDAGWPPLMRINPLLDWKCRDVWQYMYMYNVPYCSLYQKGYTSIGNKKDTLPNPYLRVIDKTTGTIVDYRPGHELIDNDELERAGRLKIPKESK